MADFFTDSDDDKAVEDLLSQAMDATVLEQVAAVNFAGCDDDGLPFHLQSRFHKLKSFPSSASKPTSLSTKSFNLSHTPQSKKNDTVIEPKSPLPGENGEKKPTNCSTKSPTEKSCLSDNGTPSPSPFRESSLGKMKRNGRKSRKSPSSDGFSSRSVSPAAKSGCFLCSPKRVSRKRSEENSGLDFGIGMSKSEKRMIKKAMEEEERISREAEKIVKWAKQASARMEFRDELSDDDDIAKFP